MKLIRLGCENVNVRHDKVRSMYPFDDYVVPGISSSSNRGVHGASCQRRVISVEFEATTTHWNVSVIFWEGKELVAIVVAYCGRDDLVAKSKCH